MSDELNSMYRHAYNDLRRLAASALRAYPSASLSPTTLVHEAWMRLERSPELADTSPAHFKAIAARAMRHIVIEELRRRSAQRRGGPGGVYLSIELDETVLASACTDEHILQLDAALCELRAAGAEGERMESAAVLRWYGGCTVAEVSQALGISETMVERDWRMAKAWLKSRLMS